MELQSTASWTSKSGSIFKSIGQSTTSWTFKSGGIYLSLLGSWNKGKEWRERNTRFLHVLSAYIDVLWFDFISKWMQQTGHDLFQFFRFVCIQNERDANWFPSLACIHGGFLAFSARVLKNPQWNSACTWKVLSRSPKRDCWGQRKVFTVRLIGCRQGWCDIPVQDIISSLNKKEIQTSGIWQFFPWSWHKGLRRGSFSNGWSTNLKTMWW
jgi:hypothetical protein